MNVRFVDDQGTEYALVDLAGAPQKGDSVTVVNGDGTEDKGTVLGARWVVPSIGDPPKSDLPANLVVVVKF
jgi:hypothetical protein